MPVATVEFCGMCGVEITETMHEDYDIASHPYLGVLCPECTLEAEDSGLDDLEYD